MSGHTKEPWDASITSMGTVEISASGNLVAEINSDDENAVNYAHRIVDCVNALAGIPDPASFVEAAGGMADALEALTLFHDSGGHEGDADSAIAASHASLAAFRAATGETAHG